MIAPSLWLEQAQGLSLDGQSRINHDCGGGKTLVINHTDTGWSCYCHRCGERGWYPRPTESLAERLARNKARAEAESKVSDTIVPPMPMLVDVTEWPDAARVWLYKAGISNEDIATLGIYYHAETDRVVIPVIDEHGALVYWQARAYDWTRKSTRPKYLNPYKASTTMGVWFGRAGGYRVVCEDYLSAYRVNKAGYDSVTLLGTKVSDKVCARLCIEDRPVVVWLDNDLGRVTNPGQEAARIIVNHLKGLGIGVVNIVSTKDPKLHSVREIRELIGKDVAVGNRHYAVESHEIPEAL